MNKSINSFDSSEILIKTFTKKISYIVISISFLLGLLAYIKRDIKYELSTEFGFQKFGIEEHLICKYEKFQCLQDFSSLSISDLAFKELQKTKASTYFNALSIADNSLIVLTKEEDSVELFKEFLIKIENSLIEKEKKNLNTFYQTLNEENKVNLIREETDLLFYEYKAKSIENHIINGGKILFFKEPRVKEISKGYEMIFIFIFIGFITSTLITLIREKFLMNN